MRTPAKKTLVAFLLLSGALISALGAQTPPAELFARVKTAVAAGAYAEGLEKLADLEAETRKPENERARAPLRPAAAFYRGVCLAALGEAEKAREEFAVFIAANPEKNIDRKAYPTSVVAAFERARKSRAGGAKPEENLSVLALAYRSTAFPSQSLAPPAPDWGSGPVKYLLSGEETRAFSRLSDDSARAEFVSRFWLARDPRPDTPENEFRREFERRAAFADENFSEGSTRGSLTDRGMVFVLLGPPTSSVRRALAASEDTPEMLSTTGRIPTPRSIVVPTDLPNSWKEIWRYRGDDLPRETPHKQVDFAFVTRTDYGKNLLQRDGPSIYLLDAARPKPHAIDY